MAAFLLFTAQTLPDEVGDDPYTMCKLDSQQFTVRFPCNVESYAHRTLDYAEYVYPILSEKLNSKKEHITIQLVDHVDTRDNYDSSSDGSDYILLYLWPSEGIAEMSYHGDWLEESVAHHIARLLIQQTSVDFVHSFNNLLLPMWYLDGLSSLYEHPETPGIYVKHGVTKSVIRSAARHGTFSDLYSLMTGENTWMGKDTGRLYGMAFLDSIAQKYGIESLTRWNVANVSTFSSIGTVAEDVYGKDWSELYEEWVTHLETVIEDKEIKEPHRLTRPWQHEYPQIVPRRHAISYVRENGAEPRGIVLHDLDTSEEETIILCKGQCEHHWSEDGATLYFTSSVNNVHFVEETLFELKYGSTTPLKVPIPGHVRSFTVDEGRIVAVIQNGDAPQIYRYDPGNENDEPLELVYTAPQFSLVEGIAFVAQDKWVASFYDPKKKRFDLALLTDRYSTIDIFPLTDDSVTERYPFVMQDGRIGYVTDVNGHYQLHAVSLDGTSELLHTHDTALLQPTQDADGTIYYADVDYDGVAIAELPWEELDPQPITDTADAVSSDDIVIQAVEAESSKLGMDWSAFIPSIAYPCVGMTADSGWFLGFGFANKDNLNHHTYSGFFDWFFKRDSFDLNLTYRWHQYKWWLEASTGVDQKSRTIDFGNGKDYYYPYMSYFAYLSTGTSWHFPNIDIELSFKLLMEYTKTHDHSLNELYRQWFTSEPTDEAETVNQMWSNAIIIELTLSHYYSIPQSIPGKTGYEVQFISRVEPPFFLNEYYTGINSVHLFFSWPMPWRYEDVFAFSLDYGFAKSGNIYRYPLEVDSGSGFDFNWFGLNKLVTFHGIREGHLVANNHLIHAQMSYKLPVYVWYKNHLKIPFSLRRVGLGLLGDWAAKGNRMEEVDLKKSAFGVGVELYLDTMLWYNYAARIGLGYERGFGDYSDNSYYIFVSF
ncbi:MAG: hypothetical protein IJU23_09130 [Proteobacteria bacterium]|nr:hypothetical protein [Pseudomonadota bacterium]